MDRICVAVLNRIHELSPAGRYVIIAEDEFYEDFPEEGAKSAKELERALTLLRRGGYIDLKYSRGDMYCVAPLKEYYEEDEPEPLPPPAEQKQKKFDLLFLSAFAGSALGSLVISLIFALI